VHYYWAECEVPIVDESGHAVVTNTTGKVGDRFAKPRQVP